MDNITTKMNRERIKKVLLKHYSINYGGEGDRELVEYDCSGSNWKTKLFLLAGSPPKGYAIYMEDKRVLCLYDPSGKRFKEYEVDNIN